MTNPAPRSPALESSVALLLRIGTWTACAVLGVGIVLGLAGYPQSGSSVDRLGIGLFILLPVARLAILVIAFSRARERAFAGISAAIILIIALGTIEGVIFTR
jgi:uncharacterized membrane protein